MKRFDLTFSGKILDDFDVYVVKQALGTLLEIQEPSELDALFIGSSFVLGQNLDRKSAAELYSKLTSQGAGVELVTCGSAPADAKVLKTPFSPQDAEGLQQRLPPLDKKVEPGDTSNGHSILWPVRSGRQSVTSPNKQHTAKPTEGDSPEAEPVNRHRSQAGQRLAGVRERMRALQQEMEAMKSRARVESSRLERRIAHFQRIAARDICKIEMARNQITDQSTTLVESLEQSALNLRADTERKLARLKERERKTARQTKLETDRLQGLIIQMEDEEQSALEQLDQARAEIRERTDSKVQELLAQIEELESMAASELSTIEQQAHDHIDSRKQERNTLAKEQAEICDQAEERIQWLREQQRITAKVSEDEVARIEQMRCEKREARKEALLALQVNEEKVNKRLERNLERAHQADAKARESSKEALQALHAQKLELQRQATMAMHEAGDQILDRETRVALDPRRADA